MVPLLSKGGMAYTTLVCLEGRNMIFENFVAAMKINVNPFIDLVLYFFNNSPLFRKSPILELNAKLNNSSINAKDGGYDIEFRIGAGVECIRKILWRYYTQGDKNEETGEIFLKQHIIEVDPFEFGFHIHTDVISDQLCKHLFKCVDELYNTLIVKYDDDMAKYNALRCPSSIQNDQEQQQ